MVFDFARQFYTELEYPALASQRRQWAEDTPLRSLRILDAAPVFRNTVLKYEALLAGGASLTVGISGVMPYDSDIVRRLRDSGIPVVHAAHDHPETYDVILDCAGAFSRWPARYGVSELTRSGAHVYAGAGKPVFLADEGRIKRIETCLGTGDGFIRAMALLGHSDWQGKRLVVFGSGKVGTGIIYRAAKSGAVVDVVTAPATLSPLVRGMVRRCVDCADVPEVAKVLLESHAVVTATGFKDVVSRYGVADALIAKGTLLANMGVEDEYGDAFPATAVLNEKRPLNFILDDPTRMCYIDATMALHNEGARYLITTQPAPGIIVPPAETETAIQEVTRRNGLIGGELELI